MRLLSVRSFPPRFALWNMGSLIGDLYQATLQYPCPFLITLGVHVLGRRGDAQLGLPEGRARAPPTPPATWPASCPTCRSARPTGTSCCKALDDGQQLVDLQHQVALFAPPEAIARAEQAARAIFRRAGLRALHATR
jgi:conjugal transfer ATP-binding protein TraC